MHNAYDEIETKTNALHLTQTNSMNTKDNLLGNEGLFALAHFHFNSSVVMVDGFKFI